MIDKRKESSLDRRGSLCCSLRREQYHAHSKLQGRFSTPFPLLWLPVVLKCVDCTRIIECLNEQLDLPHSPAEAINFKA